MKKIFLILTFALTGCCMVGQIPPQIIYADSSCKTTLPDYTKKLIVSDNCKICEIRQDPAAGFVLCDTVLSTFVVLTAIDCSGNFRQVRFSALLVDTIKPTIKYDSLLYAKEIANISKTQIIYLY